MQEELEIPQGTYIVLHWRDGEESCHVERPEFHVGYDYFTGAGGAYRSDNAFHLTHCSVHVGESRRSD